MRTRWMVMLLVSVMLMLLVMMLTPIGGWSEGNIDRESYMMFFLISVFMVITCVIMGAIDKEKN